MKIGDRIFVRGYIDEIRKDTVIVRNDGGYFGTIPSEVTGELPSAQPHITHCAECIHWQHSAVRKSYCEVFDWMNTAEDFCSFAEARTDE